MKQLKFKVDTEVNPLSKLDGNTKVCDIGVQNLMLSCARLMLKLNKNITNKGLFKYRVIRFGPRL